MDTALFNYSLISFFATFALCLNELCYFPQITPTIEDPDVFKDIEGQVEKVLRRRRA